MDNELPIGWIETGLLDIVEVYTGKKDANYATSDGKYLFFTCAYEPLRSDDYSFEGDVLILPGNGVNVGEVFYYSGKFEAYQRTYIVSNIKIDPKYLFYHFKRYWKEIGTAQQYGSATNYIKIGNFNDYRISFPPLSEQQRIVAKIDTLFGHLDALKARLDRIPQLLKDFRQKVLTQAVTGKLTKPLTKWEKTNLGNLVFKGGIFDGPFGSNLKTEDYTSSGVRVIRLENIEFLNFVEEKETFVSEGKYNTLTRHTVREGDIIFSSFISEDIRACILPELKTKAIAKADCFCIRPDETKMDKKYLLFLLVSKISFNQLVANIHGATRPRINTTQLKTLIISLPPLEEQQEIVRRVESLFAKADQIEASYQKLKAKIEQLPQALLAKAFRGERVEQLPADGDARDLLEQIKQAKEGLEKGGKGKKMKVEDEVRMVAEEGTRYGKK